MRTSGLTARLPAEIRASAKTWLRGGRAAENLVADAIAACSDR